MFLERSDDLYHGYCWRRVAGQWAHHRVLYRKGQHQPVGMFLTGTPEDILLGLLDGSSGDGPLLDTPSPRRRFATPDEIGALLDASGTEAAAEIQNCLASFLDRGILVWRDHVERPVPQRFAEVAPCRDARAKVVRQFSDLTLLWHTARLTDIPATVPVNDNPVLAVPAWVGDSYEMLDGRHSLSDILIALRKTYGTSRVTPDRLLSVVSRLSQLGFLSAHSQLDLAGAPIVWPQDEWDFDVSQVQRSYINTDLPMYVLLELTARCTRACPYCYKVSHGHEQDMPDEDYLKDVLQSVIDSGIAYTTLLGGEPLLRRDLLFECVRRLKEANVFAKLITNGDLLDESAAQTLSDLGLNKIELSLDGFTPEHGDRFRGPGSVESVERALRNLAGTRISDIGLSITVSSANYGDIVGNLSGFLDRYPHMNKVYFSRYFESPHMASVSGINELTPAQVRYLSEKIETEWKPRFRERPGFDMAVLDAGMCSCGRSLAVLTCEGAIKPCPFTHDRGALLTSDTPFHDLWQASFHPLRMEDKATCWARKVRDRMALPVLENTNPATTPVTPTPEVPAPTDPLVEAVAQGDDLASALTSAVRSGFSATDITASLYAATRPDPAVAARVKKDLLAATVDSSIDKAVRSAAGAAARWLSVGTVVFVSPEAWPASKGGGMASAVAGRAASLAASGLKVHIVTPLYAFSEVSRADGPRDRVFTKDKVIARLGVEYTGDVIEVPTLSETGAVVAIAEANHDGVHYVLLDSPVFADALYGYARTGEPSPSQRSGIANLVDGSFVLSLGGVKAMSALSISPSVIVGNDWMCAHLAGALDDLDVSERPGLIAWVHNNGTDYQFRVDSSLGATEILEFSPVPEGRRRDYADLHEPGTANFQAALLRSADHIVAVSSQQRAAYLADDSEGGGAGLSGIFQHAADRSRLHAIPNGVDVAGRQRDCFGMAAADLVGSDAMARYLKVITKERSKARRAIATETPEFWASTGGSSVELADSSFVVTMMTRITAQKGIALSDAFARAVMDHGAYPDVCFVFAGDGDEHLMERLRILGRDYPGRVGFSNRFISEDDPRGTYRNVYLAGDLCIAFSLWEPGGLSVMESLAFGVPCLVSDRQGHRDTVRTIALTSAGSDEPGANGARFAVTDGNAKATLAAALHAFDTLYKIRGQQDSSERWNSLVTNALLSDNNWESSLGAVEDLLNRAAVAA